MNKFGVLVLALGLLALNTGCASVTRGTNDVLEVKTDPIQATVEIYRLDRGFTKKELERNTTPEQLREITAENEGKDQAEQFAGPLVGLSPASFSLARKGEYRVEVTKPGFSPATISVKNEVAGGGAAGMAGNVILGGVIGAGVDASTGAMLNLVPNPIDVKLIPLEDESGGDEP